MSRSRLRTAWILTGAVGLIVVAFGITRSAKVSAHSTNQDSVAQNAVSKVEQGEQIFRFDTFGDESFWGDHLPLSSLLNNCAVGGS